MPSRSRRASEDKEGRRGGLVEITTTCWQVSNWVSVQSHNPMKQWKGIGNLLIVLALAFYERVLCATYFDTEKPADFCYATCRQELSFFNGTGGVVALPCPASYSESTSKPTASHVYLQGGEIRYKFEIPRLPYSGAVSLTFIAELSTHKCDSAYVQISFNDTWFTNVTIEQTNRRVCSGTIFGVCCCFHLTNLLLHLRPPSIFQQWW